MEDHQITYIRDDRQEVHRILRVWQGFVMLTTQNCEIEFRNDTDSRLQIGPIVSRNQWPEAPWQELQANRVPGYFYLPPLPAEEAHSLGLPVPWPESVVVFASGCLSSIRLIKPRRQLALSVEAMIHLQDSLVRFYSVRGFAAVQDFDALRGKRLIKVVDANHIVQGPSRLMKMYLGENEAEVDERDDEATVTFFGFRT